MATRTSRSLHNTPKNSKPLKEKIAKLQRRSILYENNVNLYVPKGSPVQVSNLTPASMKTFKDLSSVLNETDLSDKEESSCRKLSYPSYDTEVLNSTPSPSRDKYCMKVLSPDSKRNVPSSSSAASYIDLLIGNGRKDRKTRIHSRNGACKAKISIFTQDSVKEKVSTEGPKINVLPEAGENDALLWSQVNTLLETHGFSPVLLTDSHLPDYKSICDTFVNVISEFSKLHRQYVVMAKETPDLGRITSSTRLSDAFKSLPNSPKLQERGRNFIISKEEKVFESFLKRRFDPDNFMDSHIMAIITFYEEKLKLKESELTSLRDQSGTSDFRATMTSFSKYNTTTETLSSENNLLKEEISYLKSELNKVMEYKQEIDKSFTGLPTISDVVRGM